MWSRVRKPKLSADGSFIAVMVDLGGRRASASVLPEVVQEARKDAGGASSKSALPRSARPRGCRVWRPCLPPAAAIRRGYVRMFAPLAAGVRVPICFSVNASAPSAGYHRHRADDLVTMDTGSLHPHIAHRERRRSARRCCGASLARSRLHSSVVDRAEGLTLMRLRGLLISSQLPPRTTCWRRSLPATHFSLGEDGLGMETARPRLGSCGTLRSRERSVCWVRR